MSKYYNLSFGHSKIKGMVETLKCPDFRMRFQQYRKENVVE